MLAQAKAMELIWSTSCGGRAGRLRFQGAKKLPYEREELNALVTNTVTKVLKNKRLKAKAKN